MFSLLFVQEIFSFIFKEWGQLCNWFALLTHHFYEFLFSEFNLTDSSKATIEKSISAFKKVTDSMDMKAKKFSHFGKKFLKQQKLSPDSFMQLAVQVCTKLCTDY